MIYPRKLITPPAGEPILLAEAKLQCNIDHDEDNFLLVGQIIAARQHVEDHTSRALMTQTWDVYLPCFPCGDIVLPFGNLQAVTEFAFTNTAGSTTVWTVAGTDLTYSGVTVAHVDTISEPGRIVLAYGQSWPSDTLKTANPIRVRFTCGYGDAEDVPEVIKAAIKLQVRSLYDNRSEVVVGESAAVDSKVLAKGVDSLLANHRLYY